MGTRLSPLIIPVVTFIDLSMHCAISIPALNYFDAEDFLRSTSDVKQIIILLLTAREVTFLNVRVTFATGNTFTTFTSQNSHKTLKVALFKVTCFGVTSYLLRAKISTRK